VALFVAILFCIACAIGLWLWRKERKRQHLLDSALFDDERAIIDRLVPLVAKLPPDLRAAHEGKVALFLDQVDFYGCEGLEMSDEIRLSIAAQACLLLVNSPAWYEYLRTILVYPSAFKSQIAARDGFVVHEGEQVRLGESWAKGPVVLSWAHSRQGGLNDEDGHNVVLHEFAHQLDDLSGYADGVPILDQSQSFAQWEAVFLEGFDRHVQNVSAGRKTVLDPYGATNHQEFFAVAIEMFFEKPDDLMKGEPAIYGQLSQLLRLDPLAWRKS